MPKYGKMDPVPRKLKDLLFHFLCANDPTNTLPTSPQPLFNDDFSLRYCIKRYLCPFYQFTAHAVKFCTYEVQICNAGLSGPSFCEF